MDINVSVFSGNLTSDPILKSIESDKMVTEFNLAVDFGFGEGKKTFFPKFVAWGNLAKYITSYGSKGDFVIVQGIYMEQNWEKDDKKHRSVVFKVKELKLRSKQINQELTTLDSDGIEEFDNLECEIIE